MQIYLVRKGKSKALVTFRALFISVSETHGHYLCCQIGVVWKDYCLSEPGEWSNSELPRVVDEKKEMNIIMDKPSVSRAMLNAFQLDL